ncbi:hypothetical protein CVT26_012123 [Gymnopilus dilepis]|uniref:Uncharacterized protein n=1 Tax=Gymnopilus dilepis TaxID=231916 RepID=A0A409YGL6_9AGAR|nr:hypothetical protein CVT26_012123 [Gymnopilus dilepis]
MLDCYKREPSAARQQLGAELERAHNGLDVRTFIQDYYCKFERTVSMVLYFLLGICEAEAVVNFDQETVERCLYKWMRRIKAPTTVVIANRGIGPSIRTPGWSDLGTTHFRGVKTAVFENGHFDMFENGAVVELLEKGW